MPLQSVYIERSDEEFGPPEQVLKVSFFAGGHGPSGEFMQPVLFFAIGDYDEGTYEDSFKSSEGRQFAVDLKDLFYALGALGAAARIEPAVDISRANIHAA